MTIHLCKTMRRLAAGLLMAAAVASPALAADLNILVPYPAGGPSDAVARRLAQEMRPHADVPVQLENVPGAGGLIGLDRYVRRPLAERGILAASNSELIVSLLTTSSSKLKPEDFRLLAVTGAGNFVLLVRAGLPFRSFDELVAHLRSQPERTLKFGHMGQGTLFHLAWEDLAARAGITALQVPYKGGPDLLRDMGVGDLDAAFLPLNEASVAFPGARAIGMTGAVRHPNFPQVATLNEGTAGRGYTYEGWFAAAVMRDTPAAELDRLERMVVATVRGNTFIESSRARGAVLPPPMTREQLDQFYAAEVARHRALIARLGLGS